MNHPQTQTGTSKPIAPHSSATGIGHQPGASSGHVDHESHMDTKIKDNSTIGGTGTIAAA